MTVGAPAGPSVAQDCSSSSSSRRRLRRGCPRRWMRIGLGSVSPSTPTAYVATGANVANPGDTVSVVDLATSKVQAPVTVGTLPSALAVTPGGNDLLVAIKGQDQLVEIDTASGKIVGRVTVGLEPDAVAVTPDGSLALVANLDDNTVTPVLLPSLRAGRPIPVGRQPVSIAVSPDGRLALVADYQDGTVTPIALPSLTTSTSIPVGQEPEDVFISAAGPLGGATALVADFQTDSLTPIPLATRSPGKPIPVGGNPTDIAGWPSSRLVYVSGGDTVTPVDVPTGRSEHLSRSAPLPRPWPLRRRADGMGVRRRWGPRPRRPGVPSGARTYRRRRPAQRYRHRRTDDVSELISSTVRSSECRLSCNRSLRYSRRVRAATGRGMSVGPRSRATCRGGSPPRCRQPRGGKAPTRPEDAGSHVTNEHGGVSPFAVVRVGRHCADLGVSGTRGSALRPLPPGCRHLGRRGSGRARRSGCGTAPAGRRPPTRAFRGRRRDQVSRWGPARSGLPMGGQALAHHLHARSLSGHCPSGPWFEVAQQHDTAPRTDQFDQILPVLRRRLTAERAERSDVGVEAGSSTPHRPVGPLGAVECRPHGVVENGIGGS